MKIRVAGPELTDPFVLDRGHELLAERHFLESSGSVTEKLAAFPRFADRSSLSRFIVRYELMKRSLGVQGSIVECGIHNGGGLFTFAQLSSLLEPLNHRRRVIGFDTFAGFPSISEADDGSALAKVGALAGATESELLEAIKLYDRGRPLSEIPKVHLVGGDFMQTGPEFLGANPHLIVSLLYLDFDLREPTGLALELFLPRMPAGAVVAFDEVHSSEWPGETEALLKSLNLRKLRLERLPMSSISWAILSGDE